ncbi:MAG: hypothetical protein ABFR33_05560 [Verrucomicrobiota bacterium]
MQEIKQSGEKLNEKDVLIFRFLEANGSHSPSDVDFTKAVGLSREQLRRRLAELHERGLLGAAEETSGKTKKSVYFTEGLRADE